MEAEKLTWEGYKEHIFNNMPKGWCYRGQSNYEWPLETSYHREAKDTDVNLQRFHQQYARVIHVQASGLIGEIIDISTPARYESFLSLIQHHGFPTPVLDWTASPFIAAYFAFREIDIDKSQDGYVRIYEFNIDMWNEKYLIEEDVRSIKQPYVKPIIPYAIGTTRITYQKAISMITNQSNIEKFINKVSLEAKYSFLRVYEIAAGEVHKVIPELNLMGINEMSLFPGLDAICKTIKDYNFKRFPKGKFIN